ncbi:MAG: CHRD domain-containing protein, partial [Actinomycetota bacterium]
MRRWALLTTGILVLSLGAWVVGVSAKTTVLRAGLNGDKEVSATGEKGVGDPNGNGKAVVRIKVKRQRACFSLSWNRIVAPSMAHIHRGDADTAGPIVIPLFMTGDEAAPDDQDLPDTLDSAGGCVTGVGKPLLRRIRNNPRDFYVNIHNDPFPA